MWGDYLESERKVKALRREEEKRDPKITDRWSRTVPAAVGVTVGKATGSHLAGTAAGRATARVLEKNPEVRKKAGEVSRDTANAAVDTAVVVVGSLLAAPVLVAAGVASLFKKKRS